MRKIISLLVIGILFAGCNPCKRLTRLCPPEIHYDSVYIETVKLDTLILVSPADTTYIEVPIFSLEDFGFIVENPDQEITVDITDGVFTAEVICKEDSLVQVIHSLETELQQTTTIIPQTPEPVKYTSKFAKFTILYFFCSVLLVAVGILYRVKVGPLRSLLKRG